MQNTKSHLGRLMAALLIAVMLFGMLGVGASAATVDNVQHYDTYVCLGDSIAAGFGPYNREIKGFQRIDVAYHAQVADAVQAKTFYPLARTGMRSTEIRYMLDSSYPGDDFLFKIYKFPQELQDEMRPVFAKGVRDADLITLNCGSNDVMNYAYIRAYYAMNGENSAAEQAILDFYENGGVIGEKIAELFTSAQKMGKLPMVANEFIQGLRQGYRNFKENFDPLVKYIYDVNPDVTLVVVGMFNPMKNAKLTDISMLNVGRAFDEVAREMNNIMQNRSAYADKYLFADVWDTEVFDIEPMTDPNFQTDMMALVHPTIEGHKFMTQQILSVLPERGDEPAKQFPFTDVTEANWFYDSVYYVWDNGVMDGMTPTTFDPEGTTTRAQLATVLYRMSGKPAVSDADKTACPFTDLTADWYRDAVVWAYKTGVVNGVSETVFDPDSAVTREQMVAMLYRWKGSPAAGSDLSMFSDAGSIAAYARPAVAWAVSTGVVTGMGDGTFQPKGSATRAQLATILMRCMQASAA